MVKIDIIGGLIEWLKEQDKNLSLSRGYTLNSPSDQLHSWFDIKNKRRNLGQVTLIWPGSVPPGLQYDFRTEDEHGPLYVRKEWRTIYEPSIFDEILYTAQSIRDCKLVTWHKFFRYKDMAGGNIHRVVDTSWPPEFM